MGVPETTMYQYNSFITRQHNIRLTGQAWMMHTKPKALAVQILTNSDFRLSVLASDAGILKLRISLL